MVVGVVGGNLPVVVHGGGIGEEDADISGGIPGDSGATCPIKLPTIYITFSVNIKLINLYFII